MVEPAVAIGTSFSVDYRRVSNIEYTVAVPLVWPLIRLVEPLTDLQIELRRAALGNGATAHNLNQSITLTHQEVLLFHAVFVCRRYAVVANKADRTSAIIYEQSESNWRANHEYAMPMNDMSPRRTVCRVEQLLDPHIHNTCPHGRASTCHRLQRYHPGRCPWLSDKR